MCQKVKINYFPVFRQWENSYETEDNISESKWWLRRPKSNINFSSKTWRLLYFCSPSSFQKFM